MARHEYALCTPETARLYQHRLGRRKTLEMPYRQTIEWGGLRLTTFPAGHCLGSAMLLAEDDSRSLLYTGDFKLGEPATTEAAELPHAEILVMECTFGRPNYRRPSRASAIDELVDRVRAALAAEQTPVIHAYALGKAQEVTRILTRASIPVLQHETIYEISEIYTECGVDLGEHHRYPGRPLPGHAVIVPPQRFRAARLPGLKQTVTIAVTGWATDASARFRLGVDHAIPLSDHADFDDLLEAAKRVEPREIYCTHGSDEFVGHLCDAGFNAFPLAKPKQGRLF